MDVPPQQVQCNCLETRAFLKIEYSLQSKENILNKRNFSLFNLY